MPKIIYIEHSGERHEVEADIGQTVMEAAVMNGVPGIEASCGGACACATCHVYVAPEWREITGTPQTMEEDMLDLAYDMRDESRLSCQLRVTEAFDGLTVRVPEFQA